MAGMIDRARRIILCGGLMAACASAAALDAQTIAGRVYDEATGSPLGGAQITLRTAAGERVGGTASNDGGTFLIRVSVPGQYTVGAVALGYRPDAATVSVAAGETVRVVLRLSAAPIQLDSITATARRRFPYLEDSGFYRREERGWGLFYDRPKLERIPAAFPSQLLRSLRGVSTTLDGKIEMGDCVPAVILDGMHMGEVHLDDVVDPETIQGIEVYDSPATVPVEFR